MRSHGNCRLILLASAKPLIPPVNPPLLRQRLKRYLLPLHLLLDKFVNRVFLPDFLAVGRPVAEWIALEAVAFAQDEAQAQGAFKPVADLGGIGLVEIVRPFAGDVKANCMNDAKVRFGKS